MTQQEQSGQPLVSVIVPCYNYAHYLPPCLDSVLRQSYQAVQLILVDDGSTDNTTDVAATYGGRLEVIHKANAGLSAARNTGIEAARGQYVLFLDADDVLHPDSIAQRVRFLSRNPEVDVAVCTSRNFSRRPQLRSPFGHWHLPKSKLRLHLAHFNIAPPHAYLLRRNVVDKVGGFDESLGACEDYDYWLRAVAAGFSFAASPGLVYYRKHAASMSAQSQQQWRFDTIMHAKAVAVCKAMLSGEPDKNSRSISIALHSGMATTLSRISSAELRQLLPEILTTLEAFLPQIEAQRLTDPLDIEDVFYLLKTRNALAVFPGKHALVSRALAALDDIQAQSNLVNLSSTGLRLAASPASALPLSFRFRLAKAAMLNRWG